MKSESLGQLLAERKALLADTLYNRILNLQLAPGETLNELALCDEFGLSRSTVRITLLQLEADGLLDLRRQRAPAVVAMTVRTLEHFQQSATLIYPAGAQLAALNARPADHVLLHELLDCLDEAVQDQDLQAWLSLDNALQRRIEQIAANHYLQPGLRRLQIDHGRLMRMFYCNQPWSRIRQDLLADARAWQAIIDAITRADSQRAAQASRDYLQTLCQRLSWHTFPLHKETSAVPSLYRAQTPRRSVAHTGSARHVQ